MQNTPFLIIIKMMFDSSLTTYAVSLQFSMDVNEIISSAVSLIAEETGNSFIIENRIPPHITIGAFHAARDDEGKLLRLVEDFSRNQKTGLVHFTGIGNFKEKVLFLKPEKDGFLTEINRKLHELILPEFEKGDNGYYLPEVWFPHTTLATRLNQKQFAGALAIAEKISLPLKAEACETGFYQCSPFMELKRFTIGD